MGNHDSGKATKPTTIGGFPYVPLEDMDQRYLVPRALRAREDEVAVQHFGGKEHATPIQTSLLWRWVSIEALVTGIEAAAIRGVKIDVPMYLSLVDRLHGIGKTLGLSRVARRVPSLREYAASIQSPAPAKSAGPVQSDADQPAPGVEP